jgi:alanine racemase
MHNRDHPTAPQGAHQDHPTAPQGAHQDHPTAPQGAHRAWVEVDLGAIRHNLRQIRSIIDPSGFMAVVKANAYGHGLLPVARVALEEGAWGLAVVNVDEGLALRSAAIAGPIVIVGPVCDFELASAISAGLSLPIYSPELGQAISDTAVALGAVASVHLKVDTGLGRLAVTADSARPFLQAVKALPALRIEGIYSHYADAEGLDQSHTWVQFRAFQEVLDLCQELDLRPEVRHISASAAALLLKEPRLDLVRLGIAMYGLWPAEETRLLLLSRGQDLNAWLNTAFETGAGSVDELLRPALTYKTVVVQVKRLKTGTTVGYGCTFECQRPTVIAILPVGYAEGYDRHLSNQGEVLIRGRRARVLGRVCMNMTTVDVTDIPGVGLGEEAVLIGSQGDLRISVEEVARKIGTINYEVVTRIPETIPHLYT